MSSSTSSSSSSSSSPSSSPTSTPYDAVASDIPGPSTRRTGHFQGPSSSRQRTMNEALPEPFLEALAIQVALDAVNNNGRLAAAPALAMLFQVCSTWREASRSDLLWQRLTRRIWRCTHRLRVTWHLEFIYWHRTARNFATGRHMFFVPPLDPPSDHHQNLLCRCLALSETRIACGYDNGSVRLFDLDTRVHINTYESEYSDFGPGPYSRCVSGIVIVNSVIAFARFDGDVYVDLMNGPGPSQARRAVVGDVLNDGVLVGFAGTARRWVGLYAGTAGRAFQIWDVQTNERVFRTERLFRVERVFVGGSLTDPEAVMGWHMLSELMEPVGRVRVTEREFVVACTGSMLVCFNFWNPGGLLREVVSTSGFIVSSLDANSEAFVVIERSGVGTVRRASTFERVSRFRLRGPWVRGLWGCMNLGYVLTFSPGPGPRPLLRVWGIEQPIAELCVTLAVNGGEGNSMVANERHVAISFNDNSINLLDFGVQDP